MRPHLNILLKFKNKKVLAKKSCHVENMERKKLVKTKICGQSRSRNQTKPG